MIVGNHSHSQAQKSIEQRFNPQRPALDADEYNEQRQQDIRIEDNFNNDQQHEQDQSYEEEDIEMQNSEASPKPAANIKRNRKFEDKKHIESQSDENMFDSNNMEHFKDNMHKELLEDILKEDQDYASNKHAIKPSQYDQPSEEDEIQHKAQESTHHKPQNKVESNEDSRTDNTGGDDQNKMNKICFGVFASISHEFILGNQQKADEISLSLQSAFRVISLTRPEYKVILKTLLKCEGIKHYEVLGNNILEFVNTLKNYAPEGATDKHFSFTYYDVQAIVKSIAYLTEENWKDRRTKYMRMREKRLENLDEYTCDYRERSNEEEKKTEIEDEISSQERKERISVECDATMKTLELYAIQRCLHDWYILRKANTNIYEIDVEKEIIAKSHQIFHKVFKKNNKPLKTKIDEQEKLKEIKVDKAMAKFEEANDMKLSGFIKDGIRRFYKMIDVNHRIAIVGPICSGKSTILKIASYIMKQLKNIEIKYSTFSPKIFTYGELYGSADYIQAYSSDIKQRSSIYSLILEKYLEMDKNSDEKTLKSIVIDTAIEEVDSE